MTSAGSDSVIRVALRAVVDADLPLFFEHERSPTARWMAAFIGKDPNDRAAFDAQWAKIRGTPTILSRTIECAGRVVGHIASFNRGAAREVTYWIAEEEWGKGIATAALARFLGDETARPLAARIAADNVASRRVLEKCGFVVSGRERGFAESRDAEIDELVLTLSA